ncbi:MAG: sulfotransferase [bacterium]
MTNRTESPVIIWAPTTRCGTTLLQRLITSSGDIIVFGEDLFLVRDIPHLISKFHEQESMANQALEKFSRGEVNFWSPNVYPDLEKYGNAMVDFFYRIIGLYRETADEKEFENWGLKTPEFDQTSYEIFSTLLPRARHLFIYRHIQDVLKSQKGRGWIEEPGDVEENAETWADNTTQMLDDFAERDRHYCVQFRELLDNKTDYVGKIEEFLGISGIDMDVFDHKINTWQDDSDGSSNDSYTEPVELTEQEETIMQETAWEVLERPEFEENSPE